MPTLLEHRIEWARLMADKDNTKYQFGSVLTAGRALLRAGMLGPDDFENLQHVSGIVAKMYLLRDYGAVHGAPADWQKYFGRLNPLARHILQTCIHGVEPIGFVVDQSRAGDEEGKVNMMLRLLVLTYAPLFCAQTVDACRFQRPIFLVRQDRATLDAPALARSIAQCVALLIEHHGNSYSTWQYLMEIASGHIAEEELPTIFAACELLDVSHFRDKVAMWQRRALHSETAIFYWLAWRSMFRHDMRDATMLLDILVAMDVTQFNMAMRDATTFCAFTHALHNPDSNVRKRHWEVLNTLVQDDKLVWTTNASVTGLEYDEPWRFAILAHPEEYARAMREKQLMEEMGVPFFSSQGYALFLAHTLPLESGAVQLPEAWSA